MHPQILRDEPGRCPICGMVLTPLHGHTNTADAAPGILIDPAIVQNMGVRTAPVAQGELRQTVRAVGSLVEPEQNHLDINLRVSGWIQKLYANQEGMLVHPGDPLFDLYSPELTAAADELIAARKAAASLPGTPADPVLAKSNDLLLAAGKRKLQLLGLAPAQVDAIAALDKAPATVTFTAPTHGHIAEKSVIEGAAVQPGQRLMKIADRSAMWLQLQIYEQQLGLVALGQKVRATLPAVPGRVYEGKVDFLYPHLDTATRTAMVRVVLDNADHRLHENMYATADIDVPAAAPSLLVPRDAVIDSGLRQLVYLDDGDGHFSPRQVTVGRTGRRDAAPGDDGDFVQILSGLEPADVVVTSGQFLLDSESRLQEANRKFSPAAAAPRTVRADESPAPAPAPSPARAADPVTAVVRAYLPLAAFFGAPQKDTTPADPAGLLAAANALAASADPALQAAGKDLLAAAKALEHQPVAEQRARFKPLSKTVVDLAKSRPLAPGFGKVYAFQCTMDGAQWLQQTPTPANPYFPVEMKTCGEVTQAIAPAATPATHPTPEGHAP
jgi:RND family efflux transporter MFP subunit